MNIKQAIYLLINKVKSWEPKHVDRPLSANQTSNWEWIAPKNGTLYLVFTTYERSYSTVQYNNSATIATVAVPGATSPTIVTVPIRVKKGDKINVNNLNDKCYLSKSETSFIRGGGITLAISTLSALLGRRCLRYENEGCALLDFAENEKANYKRNQDSYNGHRIVQRALLCGRKYTHSKWLRVFIGRCDNGTEQQTCICRKFKLDLPSFYENTIHSSNYQGELYQDHLTVRGCAA